MRRIFLLFLPLFVSISITAHSQKADAITTIILVRHAEKDTTGGGDDPGLTTRGEIRARKLAIMFPNAKPDALYATPYNRTKQTLAPWAAAAKLEIKTYDAARLDELANQLKLLPGKTIVVAGHSNTTPALANLLIGSDRYRSWEDEVYNKLFVITVTKGKAKAKVIEY